MEPPAVRFSRSQARSLPQPATHVAIPADGMDSGDKPLRLSPARPPESAGA